MPFTNWSVRITVNRQLVDSLFDSLVFFFFFIVSGIRS